MSRIGAGISPRERPAGRFRPVMRSDFSERGYLSVLSD